MTNTEKGKIKKKTVRITTDTAMLVLRDAAAFCAFKKFREPRQPRRGDVKNYRFARGRSLHEGKLVRELESIYYFMHLV
jgi:hypothetical protein